MRFVIYYRKKVLRLPDCFPIYLVNSESTLYVMLLRLFGNGIHI